MAATLVWNARIVFLGQMPVGGDVTSFFLPLMSYYQDALSVGRVPLWNELWGFGFPMLAESQAGVFYPLHLILYGLLPLESAFCLNIVIHQFLAGWFAYLAARWLRLDRLPATLAGLVYMGNGFFIIHFPHQWSYTSGAWLPLILGLAWKLLADEAPTRKRILIGTLLAISVGVQLLIGHFQIAFQTQVCLALLASFQVLMPGRFGSKVVRGFAVLLCVGCGFLIASVQILPTLELIRTALPNGRDYEYLSGFALAPPHVLNLGFPALFHSHPSWRPIAWDPWHTAPEECLLYIGTLPLLLAAAALFNWSDPRVRVWSALGLTTFCLSLGPYIPGFRWLIELPGFGGFRAYSRWSLCVSFFLGLLAALTIHRHLSPPTFRKWVTRFSAAWLIVATPLTLGLYGLLSSPSWIDNSLGKASETVSRAVSPWPNELNWDQLAQRTRQPEQDLSRLGKLANHGHKIVAGPGTPALGTRGGLRLRIHRLSDVKWPILAAAIGPPFAALVILLTIGFVTRSDANLKPILVLFTALELGLATYLRPTDYHGRSWKAESPVFQKLTELQPGSRILDRHQNLSMLASLGPVQSYRTVDIPILQQPLQMSAAAGDVGDLIRRRLGISFHLDQSTDGQPAAVLLHDEVLARIVWGPGLVQQLNQFTASFALAETDHASRAWFVPTSIESLREPAECARWLLSSQATAVEVRRPSPAQIELLLDSPQPGTIILTELWFPGWIQRDRPRSGTVLRNGSGCIAIPVLTAGSQRVQLSYHSTPFQVGKWLSAAAIALILSVMLAALVAKRT